MRGFQGEKGKALGDKWRPERVTNLTQRDNVLVVTWYRNAARACARAKRNDVLVGSPPNLRSVCCLQDSMRIHMWMYRCSMPSGSYRPPSIQPIGGSKMFVGWTAYMLDGITHICLSGWLCSAYTQPCNSWALLRMFGYDFRC